SHTQIGILLKAAVGLRKREPHFRSEAVSLFGPIQTDDEEMAISDGVHAACVGLLYFQSDLLAWVG
ncbi:MAG: hypothetical protein EBX54_08740, partial [Betaproteobacteria bacterium]|nr:hypothetical protein [Betaproteobacteria bacterium]